MTSQEKLKEWDAAAEGLHQITLRNDTNARQVADSLIEKYQAGTINPAELNALNMLLRHFRQTLPENGASRLPVHNSVQTLTPAQQEAAELDAAVAAYLQMKQAQSPAPGSSSGGSTTAQNANKATAAIKAEDIDPKEAAEIDAVVNAYRSMR